MPTLPIRLILGVSQHPSVHTQVYHYVNIMEKLLNNLNEIENWIKSAPDPATFKNNDDFMGFIVELMNHSLYLLRVGASLGPSEEAANKGFSKHRAIILGHMVRIVKLYEGLLIHISQRQLELAAIFSRLIFETAVRMKYLITKAKRKSFRSFVLASYKPEKEILADLDDKAKNRPLIQIEKRIRRKVKARLKRDGISITELMNNRIWNVDGRDFRRILIDLNIGLSYSYMFGSGSHSVHGDWYEISQHHIKKDGRYYTPELTYDDPDPRLACALTRVCLDTLLLYLKWGKLDPDDFISPIIWKLLKLNREVDITHENTLGP